MLRLTGSRVSPWNAIGVLGIAAGGLIQCYYVMLIGWILGYFVMIVTGRLAGASPEALAATFASFTSTPGPVIGYTALVFAALALLVGRGLRAGLERLSKVAMPLLFLLLIALAVRSVTFPGAAAGLRWYLSPDLSAISAPMALAALGQAFYSIGIGMAAAFCFGSYLEREGTDVPGNAALVVLFDTGVAFLAGLVIFPALFAFGLAPDTGPGLVFLTMTNLFASMPAGQLFGGLFFLLLLLAALTSAAAMHEVLTVTVVDLTAVRRRSMSWITAGIVFVLSIPVILSQGPWSRLRLFGMDLFALADTVSGNILLPAGALVLTLYTAFVWGFDSFRRDVHHGPARRTGN
jgi:NSS family neurotransmitter:Na+ symporter